MSLNKSATRRLSLLAGSSLAAASLTAFAGAALAPSIAFAQAVCTPVPSSGGGTNAVTYNAATYNPGITCTASGGAMIVTTAGAISVSTTDPTPGVDDSGINLVGGAQNVTWNSAAGAVTGGLQTNGAVIDVATTTGAISITTAGLSANQAGTTYGIRAIASGAAAVTVTRSAGLMNNLVIGGQAAIWAQSGGGAVSVTNGGGTNGRLRGILAQTSGTGTVTVTINGNIAAAADDNNPATQDGIAAIDTIAGTGATTVTNNGFTISGGAGAAIRSASASTSASNAVTVQNIGGVVTGRVDFSGVTAGGVSFNNLGASSSSSGRWGATGASVFGAGADTLAMSGIGLNTLASGSSIDFGAGADTWNMSGLLAATDASVNFGAGTDTFNMSGALAVSGALTLTNLEAFNHSGVIYMGGTTGTATDLAADDVLVMSGGTFNGSGSARVVMDVVPGTGMQEGCATIMLGDCLDLRGASTAGVTMLTLNDINAVDASQGGFNSVITLVDVGGGTSAAGHFVIDPETAGYVDDPFGGAISRPGLFIYGLRYDAANQRHNLVGLPRREALEYAMLGGAAQSIWHMTSHTVTDRQSDLRDGAEEGSVWVRTAGEYTQRDVATDVTVVGATVTADNSYKLYAGTIMGGMDLISGESGGLEYAAGVQLGYVSSSFALNESETSGRFSGATGGAYASLWSDGFFANGTVNVNGLTLDYDSPGLGSKTNTYLNSIGAAAEAGARLRLTENTVVEPLAAVSWMRTSFEEISLAGGEIQPSDAESLRAGLGMRLAATLPGESVSASYFVTGRSWYEFEGESGGVVHNPGADLSIADELTGAFGEAELGVNVFNASNTLSGFLTSGVKWKDGYSALNLSFGVRMAW